MTAPTGQPPSAGGKGAAGIVVKDKLISIVRPQSSKALHQRLPLRQGMAPSGTRRAGQIPVQVQMLSTRKVALPINPFAVVLISQSGAAVEQTHRLCAGPQRLGADQIRVHCFAQTMAA